MTIDLGGGRWRQSILVAPSEGDRVWSCMVDRRVEHGQMQDVDLATSSDSRGTNRKRVVWCYSGFGAPSSSWETVVVTSTRVMVTGERGACTSSSIRCRSSGLSSSDIPTIGRGGDDSVNRFGDTIIGARWHWRVPTASEGERSLRCLVPSGDWFGLPASDRSGGDSIGCVRFPALAAAYRRRRFGRVSVFRAVRVYEEKEKITIKINTRVPAAAYALDIIISSYLSTWQTPFDCWGVHISVICSKKLTVRYTGSNYCIFQMDGFYLILELILEIRSDYA